MVPLILSQIILKTLYEVIALPVTIRVVRATKNIEGIDVYDEGVNYRPGSLGLKTSCFVWENNLFIA